MQPALEVAPRALEEVRALPTRQLVEMHRSDVHRRLGRLEVEERGIQAGKGRHRGGNVALVFGLNRAPPLPNDTDDHRLR